MLDAYHFGDSTNELLGHYTLKRQVNVTFRRLVSYEYNPLANYALRVRQIITRKWTPNLLDARQRNFPFCHFRSNRRKDANAILNHHANVKWSTMFTQWPFFDIFKLIHTSQKRLFQTMTTRYIRDVSDYCGGRCFSAGPRAN